MRYNKPITTGERTASPNRRIRISSQDTGRTPAMLCGLMRYMTVNNPEMAHKALGEIGVMSIGYRTSNIFAVWVLDSKYDAIMQVLREN